MRSKQQHAWEEPFQEAISDVSSRDLMQKIAVARTAINARISELLLGKGRQAERQAILDALSSLQLLEMSRPSPPQQTDEVP